MTWRPRAPVLIVATLLVLAVFGTSCTVTLRDPGVSASCGPVRYVVNSSDVSLSTERRAAIDDAVEEFAALLGRRVSEVDFRGQTAAGSAPGGPVVIELAWPEESPHALGFAEPHLVGEAYSGGWVLLNPTIRNAPVGLIRRLVLHELGHLYGLDDVADPGEIMDPSLAATEWGPGDLVGLLVTHRGGCGSSALVTGLRAALD
jgi:hypothetical protein